MSGNLCKRDSKGWRVPREGTTSRAVYDRHVKGMDAADIAKELKKSLNTVRVLIHRFQHWEAHNKLSYDLQKRKRQ